LDVDHKTQMMKKLLIWHWNQSVVLT